jgi:pre-60S factor REI1
MPTLGADGLSLVLPSGRVLGHRSLKVYYDQNFRQPSEGISNREIVAAKVAAVKSRLRDPSQALIPASGGHGAYGRGLQMIKARNPGEARWAKKMGNSFLDQKKREHHKTLAGYRNNNQKRTFLAFASLTDLDFRDPLCKCNLLRRMLMNPVQ